MAGGDKQFADPQRAVRFFRLIMLEVEQCRELPLGQKAKADKDLSEPFTGPFLLRNGLIELLGGYLAGLYEQGAQEPSFTGCHLDRIVQMAEMFL
ncbi:hypothetical protein OR1_04043 [Geobacter sp. OR-1]|nr:hypothetical protein OR1_04043 [Geobacter sp. OR-1]